MIVLIFGLLLMLLLLVVINKSMFEANLILRALIILFGAVIVVLGLYLYMKFRLINR